ncbi:hypothetical protein [Candidatus Phytoplasma sacchari]|uniref:Uncharacterized protein n=1 Tax=Candidatus Phytoplasma sacchari TaxID=2609813 RepID=A0ABY7M179_9MOLU|nr:hypothetical protein O7R10_00165 [Candidatus Phytoplasma sacchari]
MCFILKRKSSLLALIISLVLTVEVFILYKYRQGTKNIIESKNNEFSKKKEMIKLENSKIEQENKNLINLPKKVTKENGNEDYYIIIEKENYYKNSEMGLEPIKIFEIDKNNNNILFNKIPENIKEEVINTFSNRIIDIVDFVKKNDLEKFQTLNIIPEQALQAGFKPAQLKAVGLTATAQLCYDNKVTLTEACQHGLTLTDLHPVYNPTPEQALQAGFKPAQLQAVGLTATAQLCYDNKVTLTEACQGGVTLTDLQPVYNPTPEQALQAGFKPAQLQAVGLTATAQLCYDNNVTLTEACQGGVTLTDLHPVYNPTPEQALQAGFKPAQLQAVGLTATAQLCYDNKVTLTEACQHGLTLTDLHPVYNPTPEQALQAGFKPAQLQTVGLTATAQLCYDNKVTLTEARQHGLTLTDLHPVYNPTPEQALQAGFKPAQLQAVGLTATAQLCYDNSVTLTEACQGGVTLTDLHPVYNPTPEQALQAGFKPAQLQAVGLTATAQLCYDNKVTLTEACQGGVTLTDLHPVYNPTPEQALQAGFKPAQLQAVGLTATAQLCYDNKVTLTEACQHGLTLTDLHPVYNPTPEQALQAGFKPAQLQAVGLTATAQLCYDNSVTLTEARQHGLTLTDLHPVYNPTPEQALQAGFKPAQLQAVGLTATAQLCYDNKVTLTQACQGGVTLTDLHPVYNPTPEQALQAGFKPAQLQAVGLTATAQLCYDNKVTLTEACQHGLTLTDLNPIYNPTPEQALQAGFKPAQLKAVGLTATAQLCYDNKVTLTEARQHGLTLTDLHPVYNPTPEQALQAGFKPAQLQAVGLTATAQLCYDNKVTLTEARQHGLTLTDLYPVYKPTPEQALQAGFKPAQLQAVGLTATAQLCYDNKVTLTEACQGGVTLTDLHPVYNPTPEQALQAGFKPAQLKAVGLTATAQLCYDNSVTLTEARQHGLTLTDLHPVYNPTPEQALQAGFKPAQLKIVGLTATAQLCYDNSVTLTEARQHGLTLTDLHPVYNPTPEQALQAGFKPAQLQAVGLTATAQLCYDNSVTLTEACQGGVTLTDLHPVYNPTPEQALQAGFKPAQLKAVGLTATAQLCYDNSVTLTEACQHGLTLTDLHPVYNPTSEQALQAGFKPAQLKAVGLTATAQLCYDNSVTLTEARQHGLTLTDLHPVYNPTPEQALQAGFKPAQLKAVGLTATAQLCYDNSVTLTEACQGGVTLTDLHPVYNPTPEQALQAGFKPAQLKAVGLTATAQLCYDNSVTLTEACQGGLTLTDLHPVYNPTSEQALQAGFKPAQLKAVGLTATAQLCYDNKVTLTEACQHGLTLTDLHPVYNPTPEQALQAGFKPAQLKAVGLTATAQLCYDNKVTLTEACQGGLTLTDLHPVYNPTPEQALQAGFKPAQLKAVGLTATAQLCYDNNVTLTEACQGGLTLTDLHPVYNPTSEQALQAGFKPAQLKAVGLTATAQLCYDNSVTLTEARQHGLTLTDLHPVYNPTPEQALQAGFKPAQLKAVGLTATAQLCYDNSVTLTEACQHGLTLTDLHPVYNPTPEQALQAGFKPAQLKAVGLTATAQLCYDNSVTLTEACQGGLTLTDLHPVYNPTPEQALQAGFKPAQLKAVGLTATAQLCYDNSVTLTEACQGGLTLTDLHPVYNPTSEQALQAGFKPAQLKAVGLTATAQLCYDNSVTLTEACQHGLTLTDLHPVYNPTSEQALQAGFKPAQLKAVGLTATAQLCYDNSVTLTEACQHGLTLTDLHPVYNPTSEQALQAGFKPAQLKAVGLTATAQLCYDNSVTLTEACQGGLTLTDLHPVYNPTPEQALQAGFKPAQLKAVGLTATAQLCYDNNVTLTEACQGGLTLTDLHPVYNPTSEQALQAGFKPAQLKAVGLTATAQLCYDNSVTLTEACQHGLTLTDLHPVYNPTSEQALQAGFKPAQLKAVGLTATAQLCYDNSVTLTEACQHGLTLTDLHPVYNPTSEQALQAGFKPAQLKAVGLTATAQLCYDNSVTLTEACQHGLTLTDLHPVYNPTPEQALQAGFKPAQLKAVGLTATAQLCYDNSVTLTEACQGGLTLTDLHPVYNPTPEQALQAGFKPAQLKAVGLTATAQLCYDNSVTLTEACQGGLTLTDLHPVYNPTPEQALQAGFKPAQLKAVGLTATAQLCYDNSVTLTEACQHGLTLTDLHPVYNPTSEQALQAGFKPAQLKAVGLTATAQLCYDNSVTLTEACQGGLTLTDLHPVYNPTPEQALQAGFKPAQLKAVGLTATAQLCYDNSVTLTEACQGGLTLTDLHPVYNPTPEQASQAGFTPAQLQAVGLTITS